MICYLEPGEAIYSTAAIGTVEGLLIAALIFMAFWLIGGIERDPTMPPRRKR